MKLSNKGNSLRERLAYLRWQIPAGAFFLVVAHQIIEHTLLASLPSWYHFASQVFFYGLIGPVLVWWALSTIGRQVNLSANAEKALMELRAKPKEDKAETNLDARDKEILFLLAKGFSNQEIANALQIAEKTVRNRLSLLFKRLKIRNRTEAAMYAIKVGLAEESDQAK